MEIAYQRHAAQLQSQPHSVPATPAAGQARNIACPRLAGNISISVGRAARAAHVSGGSPASPSCALVRSFES
jgi:hypothetical protein